MNTKGSLENQIEELENKIKFLGRGIKHQFDEDDKEEEPESSETKDETKRSASQFLPDVKEKQNEMIIDEQLLRKI